MSVATFQNECHHLTFANQCHPLLTVHVGPSLSTRVVQPELIPRLELREKFLLEVGNPPTRLPQYLFSAPVAARVAEVAGCRTSATSG